MQSRTLRLSFAVLALTVASGCAGVQRIPVSTDPSGAQVFLDGVAVCPATPCSVEADKNSDHLLTIIKDGYRQRDVTLNRASGGPNASITPGVVTIRLRPVGQLDVTNPDDMLDTAVDLGVRVLKRALEDDGTQQGAPQR